MTEYGLTTAIKLLNEANEKARLALENIKTIQKWAYKEQKQGEWIDTGEAIGDDIEVKCSLCGEELYWIANFCPNCGARMGGDT